MAEITGVDVRDLGRVTEVVDQVRPDVVVCCAGVVKQRAEAKDQITCIQVNSLLPHHLAMLRQSRDFSFIHVSTDCVFSGRTDNRLPGSGYTEDDVPDPGDVYGRTKLLGEVSGTGCCTLRTSIIGHELKRRSGLVEWFLNDKRHEIPGFQNALFSGVTTIVLADLIGSLIEEHRDLDGIWQVAGPPISKYALLGIINEVYDCGKLIVPDAHEVCDRRLDGSRLAGAIGWSAPSWTVMVTEMHDQRRADDGGSP